MSAQAERELVHLVWGSQPLSGDHDGGTAQTEEAKEWVTQLDESLKNDDPLVIMPYIHQPQPVPYLSVLLRECCLSHRWPEALRVIQGLTLYTDYRTDRAVHMLWKVGCEVLLSDSKMNSKCMDQFISAIQTHSELNTKEVVLEYVKYLIMCDRKDEAKQAFQEILSKSSKVPTARTESIELEFGLYQGLVWYLEWLMARKRSDAKQNYDDDDSQMVHFSSSSGLEDIIARHADKAISCFTVLHGQRGVWDIFIQKYAELLEYRGEEDEAYSVLLDYNQTNPDNPNSHRMLYKFMKKNSYPLDVQLKTLEAYTKLVPSDSLVLELCELHKRSGSGTESILPALFDLCDYACWSDSMKAWAALYGALKQAVIRDDAGSKPVIKRCWLMRESWWPLYHFRADNQADTRGGVVMVYKAAVAVLLLGPGNKFTKETRDEVTDSEDIITEAISVMKNLQTKTEEMERLCQRY